MQLFHHNRFKLFENKALTRFSKKKIFEKGYKRKTRRVIQCAIGVGVIIVVLYGYGFRRHGYLNPRHYRRQKRCMSFQILCGWDL